MANLNYAVGDLDGLEEISLAVMSPLNYRTYIYSSLLLFLPAFFSFFHSVISFPQPRLERPLSPLHQPLLGKIILLRQFITHSQPCLHPSFNLCFTTSHSFLSFPCLILRVFYLNPITIQQQPSKDSSAPLILP